MSDVPEHVRGRVGMVAFIRRMKGDSDGRLAVVRGPAGFLSSMIGSVRPVFCWQVHLLGPPVDVSGKASRDLYVPDRCLVPAGAMSDEVMRLLIRTHSDDDLAAALADLQAMLGATDLPSETFARLASLAAERLEVERAVEIVPVRSALGEIGFAPDSLGGETLQWACPSSGVELRFSAGSGFLDSWIVMAHGSSSRTLVCEERVFPAEASRGQIVYGILSMWRNAGNGSDPIPDALRMGALHERHQRQLRSLGTGLPTLHVDGQIFRATRRWLVERHRYMDQSSIVRMDHAAGLLRLEVDTVAYACPARGSWLEPRDVLLADLAAIPPDVLRSRLLNLEQGETDLRVNGWSLRSSPTDG